ncbi:MAG: Wzz/FepE/Etk N-terminal domain-containing protein [Algibacter sp.]|uniref:Wzz/FepE/Etk N-terminal domain-containing protein n=1 Tax=Algibacter sp. TaxID=1872428 RepID=UPI003299B4A2
MSKDIQQPQQSEEVDLGQLFKLIGNAFDRFFQFVSNIFTSIFSVIIYILKALIKNFKLIFISMVVAGAIGFGLEKAKQPVYTSSMLVKPYFDSKFQLVTNINYYNALIEDKDFKQLSSLFDIEEDFAEDIIEFKISPGPETENDRILEYEEFIKQVDSTRATEIYFKDFIENRSIYSGTLYEIAVRSFKKDIFRSLEEGLNSTFTNTYSVKKMEKRDSLIAIDKSRILKSLKQVDSLQKVYIKVLQEESSSKNAGTITLKDGMSLVQERVDTREYELLDKELELRQQLAVLESEKVEEDVFFDTLSSFQDVGSEDNHIWSKYSLIFPLVAFVLLTLVFLFNRLIRFVNNYED